MYCVQHLPRGGQHAHPKPRGHLSVVAEAYATGGAHRAAATAGLVPSSGLSHLDPSLIAAGSAHELAEQLSNFSVPFHCKVSR